MFIHIHNDIPIFFEKIWECFEKWKHSLVAQFHAKFQANPRSGFRDQLRDGQTH